MFYKACDRFIIPFKGELLSLTFIYNKELDYFMGRKQYSKSDIKQFLETHAFASNYIDKKSQVVEEGGVLFIQGDVFALRIQDTWVPSLHLLLKDVKLLPTVVVDKGAIKFVVNGADIMRPGIVRCDDFQEGAMVVIVDETVGKPLAVGQALLDSEALMAATGGKSVANLHYVGDEYWLKSG